MTSRFSHRLMPPVRTLLLRCLLLGLPIAAVSVPPEQAPVSSAGSRGQGQTAPFPRKGRHLDPEECKDCHEEETESIAAGSHAAVAASKLLHGCEACHGPGFAHGRDEDNEPTLITQPARLAPQAQTRVCVTCHRDQISGHGGDPKGFLLAGKGCTSCHRVHAKVRAAPHPGLRFRRRVEAAAAAEPVGAKKCVSCHPLRDSSLRRSDHAQLARSVTEKGCETCHGHGSLHVESGGLVRLITRPDQALDGIATCRGCHEEVHPKDFHWHGRRKPLLSATATCTTCHRVHGRETPELETPRPIDRDTGQGLAGPATNRLCKSCHAPAFSVLHGTVHEGLGPVDLALQKGCGACHAGALAHARSGGRAGLVESMHGSNAASQLATCGACHEKNAHLRHVRLGSHQRHEVTCLSCHSPAVAPGKTRRDAERHCTTCHRGVEVRFRLPNHHPVPEGRMGCTDCHEPHGSRPKIRDLELRVARCVHCHKQYRGPFVFAHQASRSDGCVICHAPHGATNRRMLRQHSTQQNCLQCHADFPSFHDQKRGAVFTNCLNCHTQVHGSNHSRFLFR